MRVALLNDSFPPQVDGVVNAVVNYAAVLSARGHDVTVAVPSNPDAVDDYSFPVIRYQSLDTTKMFGYRAGNPLSQDAVQSRRADVAGLHGLFRPELLRGITICRSF